MAGSCSLTESSERPLSLETVANTTSRSPESYALPENSDTLRGKGRIAFPETLTTPRDGWSLQVPRHTTPLQGTDLLLGECPPSLSEGLIERPGSTTELSQEEKPPPASPAPMDDAEEVNKKLQVLTIVIMEYSRPSEWFDEALRQLGSRREFAGANCILAPELFETVVEELRSRQEELRNHGVALEKLRSRFVITELHRQHSVIQKIETAKSANEATGMNRRERGNCMWKNLFKCPQLNIQAQQGPRDELPKLLLGGGTAPALTRTRDEDPGLQSSVALVDDRTPGCCAYALTEITDRQLGADPN